MRSGKFTYLFITILLFLAACKVDKPILPGDPGYVQSFPPGGGTGSTGATGSTGSTGTTGGSGTTTTPQQYYVKGTLNGTAFDWEADYTNWGTGNGKNSTTDPNGNEIAELDGIISNYKSTQAIPAISIGFRTFEVSDPDQTAITAYFNNFITTGNWNYAADDMLTEGTKNIVIYYNDASGNSYSSDGAQSGSTANVTSVKQVAASLGVKESLDIKLNFSCKLYNLDGSGTSVTITNGQASINVPDDL